MKDHKAVNISIYTAFVAFVMAMAISTATLSSESFVCSIQRGGTGGTYTCPQHEPTCMDSSTLGRSFKIDYRQPVEWSGRAEGGEGCGRSFIINNGSGDHFVLSQDLSQYNTGTQSLEIGTYKLANDLLVGPGSYTIWYNKMSTLIIDTPNVDFGNLTQGDPSPTKYINIKNAGDNHDYTIKVTQVLSSSVFSIVAPTFPVDLSPGRSLPVTVRCNTGAPGNYSGTLTATGIVEDTNQLVNPSPQANLQCNVTPPKPKIACANNSALGEADWCSGEQMTIHPAFKNIGTGELVITNITLGNQAGSSVFSLQSVDTTPLEPNGTRAVDVTFSPNAEREFQGTLVIDSNDPETPQLSCLFKAKGHHPSPKLSSSPSGINFGDVETGIPVYKPIQFENVGEDESRLHINQITTNSPFHLQYDAPLGTIANIRTCTRTPGVTTLQQGETCQVWVMVHTLTPPRNPSQLTGNVSATWGKNASCQYQTLSIPLLANIAPGIADVVDTRGNQHDHVVRFGYTSQGVLPPNCPKGSAEVRISNIGIDPLEIGNIAWEHSAPPGLKKSDDRCSGRKLRKNSGPCSTKIVWDDFPWARTLQALICPGGRAKCQLKSSRSAGANASLLISTSDPTQSQPIKIEVSTPQASCNKMIDCRCPITTPDVGITPHPGSGLRPPDTGGITPPCPRPPCPGPGPLSP